MNEQLNKFFFYCYRIIHLSQLYDTMDPSHDSIELDIRVYVMMDMSRCR